MYGPVFLTVSFFRKQEVHSSPGFTRLTEALGSGNRALGKAILEVTFLSRLCVDISLDRRLSAGISLDHRLSVDISLDRRLFLTTRTEMPCVQDAVKQSSGSVTTNPSGKTCFNQVNNGTDS